MDNLFLEIAEEKMDGAIKAFETALVKVRTGRANPTMLDGIRVDYYGSPTRKERSILLILVCRYRTTVMF